MRIPETCWKWHARIEHNMFPANFLKEHEHQQVFENFAHNRQCIFYLLVFVHKNIGNENLLLRTAAGGTLVWQE